MKYLILYTKNGYTLLFVITSFWELVEAAIIVFTQTAVETQN